MQGKYITREEFTHYQQHEMDSALGVLDINLRNDNLRNQVAARLLGFSSYEALQPMFNHEWNLFNTIVYERSCPYQGGYRPVLRHRNILVVVDFKKCKIFGRVLCTGQERDSVAHWNATESISLPSHISFGAQARVEEMPTKPGENYRLRLSFAGDGGFVLAVEAAVTNNGMVVRCTMDNGGLHLEEGGEYLGRLILDYKHCLEKDAMNNINQAALKFESGEPCFEKETYQWRIKAMDGANCPRLLTMSQADWRDDRLPPTDLIFSSVAEAQRFPYENDMDYEPEDFENLVLCRVTAEIA